MGDDSCISQFRSQVWGLSCHDSHSARKANCPVIPSNLFEAACLARRHPQASITVLDYVHTLDKTNQGAPTTSIKLAGSTMHALAHGALSASLVLAAAIAFGAWRSAPRAEC